MFRGGGSAGGGKRGKKSLEYVKQTPKFLTQMREEIVHKENEQIEAKISQLKRNREREYDLENATIANPEEKHALIVSQKPENEIDPNALQKDFKPVFMSKNKKKEENKEKIEENQEKIEENREKIEKNSENRDKNSENRDRNSENRERNSENREKNSENRLKLNENRLKFSENRLKINENSHNNLKMCENRAKNSENKAINDEFHTGKKRPLAEYVEESLKEKEEKEMPKNKKVKTNLLSFEN